MEEALFSGRWSITFCTIILLTTPSAFRWHAISRTQIYYSDLLPHIFRSFVRVTSSSSPIVFPVVVRRVILAVK